MLMNRIFPVRRLQVDFEQRTKRHWFSGKPFETYWFNALSLGLPLAERYAISTIKAYLDKISEPELLANARAFIGQEATHSHVHEKCNRELKKQGFSFSIERYALWRMSKAHWLHPKSGVALTMSWEHMTTIICEHALDRIDIFNNSDEPFRELWTWHCAEELEHKCLAYDLYREISGSYARRIAIFLYGTALFVTDFLWMTFHNMYRDGRLFDPRVWMGAAAYSFGRNGFFWFWLPRWLAYFNPRYHPSHTDHRPIIERALARLSGKISNVGEPKADHGRSA